MEVLHSSRVSKMFSAFKVFELTIVLFVLRGALRGILTLCRTSAQASHVPSAPSSLAQRPSSLTIRTLP